MPLTRGSIVQNKKTKGYELVRVGNNGRLSLKSIADDAPSRFCDENDFMPASVADVPWLRLRIVRINGSDLFYWELPSGELVCESDAVWFYGGIAFSTHFCQIDPDSPSSALR